MSEQTHNVFISHIHEDDSKLADLKDLLSRNGCAIRDGSINSDKPNRAQSPDYIKQEILAPRIKWAGTMVVLISPGTHQSDYVNWEIEYAHQHDTRIVGVWDHAAKDCDVPEAFDKYGDALVGWQGERIVDAINGKIDNWESPTGKPHPERDIYRHSC